MPQWVGTLRRWFANVIIIALFACGVFLSIWDFTVRSRFAARANVYMYLTQAADQCADTFRSRLSEKIITLEMMADYLSAGGDMRGAEARRVLGVAARHESLRNVGIALPDGTLRIHGGRLVDVTNRAYFQQAMRGRSTISGLLTSRIDGGSDFFMAVPVRRDGYVAGALVASLSRESFYNTVNITTFRGKGFIYIVDADGRVVLKPQENPLAIQENFFELPQAPKGHACPLRALGRDMREEKSGTLLYVCSNGGFYMSYVPVGVNGWYVLSMVPAAEIDAQFQHMRELGVLLSAKLALLFGGVFAYIYFIRRRSARELRKKHQELQAITDNIMGGVLKSHADADFTLDYVSSGYLEIMGYSREDFAAAFDDRFMATIIEEDRARAEDAVREQVRAGKTVELDYRSRTRDGETVWFYYKGHLVWDGDDLWCYAIAFDATQQHRLAESERLAHERYRFIMDQHAMVIFDWDVIEDRFSTSARWLPLLGGETSLFRGEDTFFRRAGVQPEDEEGLRAFFHRLASGEARGVCEARLSFRDEGSGWYRIEASTLFDESGRPTRVMGLISDINMQKKLELTLRDKADRDSATGLYNKATLGRLVEEATVGECAACALLILDLDNFKVVNDTQGHVAGDAVIARVAGLLKRSFRSSDIVGRIGGDEFAACLPGLSNRAALAAKAASLLHDIRAAFSAFPVEISASIGIALAPQDGVGFAELYRKADAALYNSKHLGRNRFSFYDEIDADRFDNDSCLL